MQVKHMKKMKGECDQRQDVVVSEYSMLLCTSMEMDMSEFLLSFLHLLNVLMQRHQKVTH